MPIKTPQTRSLTKAEKDVLKLLTEDFLTPKQIQYRRQCTRQAVNKIINSLKQKGYINLALKTVDKSRQSSTLSTKNQIRLHGQEFNIKILWQDFHYQTMLKKSNILFLDGHTIKLYKNSVEVYGGEGTSFLGNTPQEAMSKSLAYWKRFFAKLEHNLKAIIVKPRTRNIKLVNQHFARGESEIYEHGLKENKRIKIYAEEDGKLCFITDDSFGMGEDETIHPQTSKPDREEIDKHLNDWRLNHPPTNTELHKEFLDNRIHIGNLSELQTSTTTLLEQINNNVLRLTKLVYDVSKRLEEAGK